MTDRLRFTEEMAKAGTLLAYQVCKYFQKEYSRDEAHGSKRGDD